MGFILGTVTIFNYGAGPAGIMRTLGKYMAGSAATFRCAMNRREASGESADRTYQCLHGRRQRHQNRCIASDVRNMGEISVSAPATPEAIPTSSTKRRMIPKIQIVYYIPEAERFPRHLLVPGSCLERPFHTKSAWRATPVMTTSIRICRSIGRFQQARSIQEQNFFSSSCDHNSFASIFSHSSRGCDLACSSICVVPPTCTLLTIFSTLYLYPTCARSQSLSIMVCEVSVSPMRGEHGGWNTQPCCTGLATISRVALALVDQLGHISELLKHHGMYVICATPKHNRSIGWQRGHYSGVECCGMHNSMDCESCRCCDSGRSTRESESLMRSLR
jgi:hypothetical protein